MPKLDFTEKRVEDIEKRFNELANRFEIKDKFTIKIIEPNSQFYNEKIEEPKKNIKKEYIIEKWENKNNG